MKMKSKYMSCLIKYSKENICKNMLSICINIMIIRKAFFFNWEAVLYWNIGVNISKLSMNNNKFKILLIRGYY